MNNSKQQTDARPQEGAAVKRGKKGFSPASTPPTFSRDEVRGEGARRSTGKQLTTREENTMKKLYRVESKVNGVIHRGLDYDEVPIHWICRDRDFPLLRPEEGIEGYYQLSTSERFSTLDALDELFSGEEAKALVEYLSRFTEITMTAMTEACLPLPPDETLGIKYRYGCAARWQGSWLPKKYDQNALPFMVSGHYDVEEGKIPQPCPVCGQKFVVGRKVDEPLDAQKLTI